MKSHLVKLFIFIMVNVAATAAAGAKPVTAEDGKNPAQENINQIGTFSVVEKPLLKLKPVIKQKIEEPIAQSLPANTNVALAAVSVQDPLQSQSPQTSQKETSKQVPITPVIKPAVVDAKVQKTELKAAIDPIPASPAIVVEAKEMKTAPKPTPVIKLKKGDNIHAVLTAAAKENNYILNWEGEELYSKYETSFESASFDKSVDSLLIAIKVNGYISGNIIYVVVK